MSNIIQSHAVAANAAQERQAEREPQAACGKKSSKNRQNSHLCEIALGLFAVQKTPVPPLSC
jgi:hypothetical protein